MWLSSSWWDEANGIGLSFWFYSLRDLCFTLAGGWRWPTCHLPTNDGVPFIFFEFIIYIWSYALFSNDHDMHSAPDPLDLITNAFWLSSNGPHIFDFIFYFWFLYLIAFKVQKIIEKSFLLQKIWKIFWKIFLIFLFLIFIFSQFYFVIGIFYDFSLYLTCFNCLKIIFLIFKF